MSVRKSMIAIVVLSVALVASLFRGCEPEADWLVKPDDPDRMAKWEGYAVQSAIFLYATKNGGRLPNSLGELKPDFIGTGIDLSRYTLHCPGLTNWSKWVGIASGRMMTPDGERIIAISGHGQVGVHKPGDS